jgi:16S rRNA (adenine1518-N6/adenine1519-N6)-dimethyltransferase
VASPGSRDYGYLTARTAFYARARLLFEVGPGAFNPPPKVDSAVVLLEPTAAPAGIADAAAFLRFVALCFSHKRKTLRNNLAGAYGKELVDGWPEAGLRAEQVGLGGFEEMFGRLGR